MAARVPPSSVPPSVPTSNNPRATQPGVPPSIPGSMAIRLILSSVLPVSATTPLGTISLSISSSTASTALVLGPINLETTYITNKIPFNNKGQFLRLNRECELNNSNSRFNTNKTTEDKIIKDISNNNKLKLA